MALSLKIDNLRKSFKNRSVLKDISFEASGSEIIGLVGKSGCGKSTLLKILVGYYKSDGGSILVNGKKVKNVLELRNLVGYTTQENSFYEKLSVLENMRYYANLYDISGKEREQRIKRLLEDVGLLDSRDVLAEDISGGMKRRLDFAISLLHNPPVLILDEPTTGLDPLLVDQFWKVVNGVVLKHDKIVIVSSHMLSEIENYCSKALLIDKGKIVKVLEKKSLKDLESKFRELLK
jgi:ABC-2 type transport system ATP-binding protein